MNKNSQEVTIIIITYKSVHIVCEALRNIIGKNYRIIIVDNGSGDNIEDFLLANYRNSGIELIILANNYGFGKSNNLALKMVKTKYAFLLNPDAIIDATSIENLIEESEKDPKVALASPFPVSKLILTQNEIDEEILAYKKSLKVFYENQNIIQTNTLCGGHLLLKTKAFEEIGLFDENLFLYWEDSDLSKRSISKGYKNILVKNSKVLHNEQSSTKITSKMGEAKMLFFRNWHMGWGKAYFEKKTKSRSRVFFKAMQKLSSSLLYLFFFNKRKVIIYYAQFCGIFSNLVGIDCFDKNHKVPRVKSTNTI